MSVHVLKTWPVYFAAVKRGEKLFEVRRNDRFFQLGDQVDLVEYDPAPSRLAYVMPDGRHSNNAAQANRLSFLVGPVLQGGQFGLDAGYCAFSLLPLPAKEATDDE